MVFDNLGSKPGMFLHFCPGHRKSWNLMLANMYATEVPTVPGWPTDIDCSLVFFHVNIS